MSQNPGSVLIIGASIAGISTALAFNRRGVPVTVIEKDDVDRERESAGNRPIDVRRGVPHALQPHFFLSSLRNAIKEWYPELLDELIEAGVKEVSVDQCVPCKSSTNSDASLPGDEELTVLTSRRAVLEDALRRFASRQSGIKIISSAKVRRLLTNGESPIASIIGAEIERDGVVEEVYSDILVDASGRSTKFLEPLLGNGASVEDLHYKSKSAYFTRHYRLKEGKDFPEFVGMPGALFDDIVTTTFVADSNNFVISIVVNQDDPILYDRSLSNPDVFEQIVRTMPKSARWIEPDRAEHTSPVFGWANMDFFWRKLAPKGAPAVTGYFPVGDVVIRSNPKFGRGCTWSVLGAEILADAVCGSSDPIEQINNYELELDRRFRAEWNMILAVDKEDQTRFEVAAGLTRATLKTRLVSLIAHATMNMASSIDPKFYRSFVRGYYGLDSPIAWTKNPLNWLRVVRANLLPSRKRDVAKSFSHRPSRTDLNKIIQRHYGNVAGR